jgi:hypothetical protein
MSTIARADRKRHRKSSPLHYTQERGSAWLIATKAIDQYFREFREWNLNIDNALYDLEWIFDDLFEAFEPHLSDRQLERMFIPYEEFILKYSAIDHWQDNFSWLKNYGREIACDQIARCQSHETYATIKLLYADLLADRLVHDRQISQHIAQYVALSFHDSKRSNRLRVQRVKFPAFVTRILLLRDKGRCATCAADLIFGLIAEKNIDHIVDPLSTTPSVPAYHDYIITRRRKTKTASL